MIIKNLQVKYQGEQDGKVRLQTDNGAEILLDSFLLENLNKRNEPLFLALDYQPLVSSGEDKKAILNELLNPQDES